MLKLSMMREELEKEAFALKNLSYMGKRLAGGTAVGAAGGAAAGATTSEEGNRLSGALKGAVGGAALGGAAGYVAPRAAAHMRSGASTGQALRNVGSEATGTLRGTAKRVRTNNVIEKAKGINPDTAGAEAMRASMKNVPAGSMRQLEGAITPQMKSMGMTPEAAAQLMNMGRHTNEPINAAISRQLAPRSVGRTFTPAAAGMATKAASSSISPEQLKAMREAIDDNVPQARSVKRMQQFVQDWKEKKGAGLSGDNPYLLDQIGKPKTRKLEAMPPNKDLITKQAFSTSQYSGTLGPGRGPKYESSIPAFVNPPVKTAGPPSEEKAKSKESAMRDEFAKLNAIQSPKSQITKAQKVGTPKASGPPGPSIQQLSKPLGFGKPIPGAIKPQQGI